MSTITHESKLTKSQVKTYGPRPIAGWGEGATITAKVRYDDECGNGHNSFAITGEIRKPRRNDCEACGMLHDEIRKAFPQLVPYLQWHLMSSDEPMHYVANTLYWLGYDTKWCDGATGAPPNLEHARSTAVWPTMPEAMLATSGEFDREGATSVLNERLAALLTEFRAAVEELGFTY